MKTTRFGRILLPIVTPFDENEEVDYGVFEELIGYLLENDCFDTLIVTGTTGEFNTLTVEERKRLFRTAVRAVKGRKPIIAGTGCASTRETVMLTNEAVEAGIDTCMVVAPYYCRPTEDAVREHYEAIAERTGADILLYNIPIFTGVNLSPRTVASLAGNRRIVGIKDEAGINPVQLTEYYHAVKDINPDFMLFNGDDLMLMPTLSQGAMGIVSGGAHLVAKEIRAVFERYYAGEVDEALAVYRKIFTFFKVNGINGRIHPNSMLRTAIELVTGIKVGKPRRPLNGIREDEKEKLVTVLRDLGLLRSVR